MPQVIDLGRHRELTLKGSLTSPTSITWKGTSYKKFYIIFEEAFGSVAVPELKKLGYDKKGLTIGSLAGAGTLCASYSSKHSHDCLWGYN